VLSPWTLSISCSGTNVTTTAGKWRWHFPLGFSKGAEVPFSLQYCGLFHGLSWSNWNKFIAAIRATRKFRIVVYHFCYCFCGQYCCWTERKILVTICWFFISFHFPQLFYCSPVLSLFRRAWKGAWSNKKHCCQQNAFFEPKVPLSYEYAQFPQTVLAGKSHSRELATFQNIKTKRTYLNYVCTLFLQYFW